MTTPLPLIDHLRELRRRLMIAGVAFFVAFGACYSVAPELYGFLLKPLMAAYEGHTGQRLIYTHLTEAFFTYLRVAMYAAFFLSFPLLAWQIYAFIAPGLYRNEKRVILPYLLASPLLFVLGVALVYYIIFPVAWKFFLSFETIGTDTALPIQMEARVGEYLSLVLQLMWAFGLSFQLPIILMLLVRTGVISTQSLIKKRRLAIVLIFAVAAVITPPDILSQIALALPLVLLYETSIFLCKNVERRNLASCTP